MPAEEEEDRAKDSNKKGETKRKIHVSRIPTSFDETIVKRILEENLGEDGSVEDVTLIYKRPDGDDDNYKEVEEAPKKKKDHKDGKSMDMAEPSLEHRGFGFVTFSSQKSYDQALALDSVRGGRKATSTKKHTLYLRPYAEKDQSSDLNVCFLWSKFRCPYGDQCKFEHQGEGGALTIHPLDPDAAKKKQKCFAFKKGKCKRGKNCPYSHDFVPKVAADAATTSEKSEKKSKTSDACNKAVKKDSEKDCINWKTKGKCRKGDQCPYRHDESLRQAALLKKKRKQLQNDPSLDASDNSKKRKKKQSLWVRVFGLNYESTKEQVREFFEECGPIMQVDFPCFEDSGRSKGYCGVLFQSPKAVAKALEFDGQELLGRWLRIQEGKMLLDQWEDREKQRSESLSSSA